MASKIQEFKKLLKSKNLITEVKSTLTQNLENEMGNRVDLSAK